MAFTLVFDAQLLGTKDGSFVSEEGRNKGQKYEWTDLQFHNAERGVFELRTVQPVQIDPAMIGKPLHWELGVELKGNGSKLTPKVAQISGSKSKA